MGVEHHMARKRWLRWMIVCLGLCGYISQPCLQKHLHHTYIEQPRVPCCLLCKQLSTASRPLDYRAIVTRKMNAPQDTLVIQSVPAEEGIQDCLPPRRSGRACTSPEVIQIESRACRTDQRSKKQAETRPITPAEQAKIPGEQQITQRDNSRSDVLPGVLRTSAMSSCRSTYLLLHTIRLCGGDVEWPCRAR